MPLWLGVGGLGQPSVRPRFRCHYPDHRTLRSLDRDRLGTEATPGAVRQQPDEMVGSAALGNGPTCLACLPEANQSNRPVLDPLPGTYPSLSLKVRSSHAFNYPQVEAPRCVMVTPWRRSASRAMPRHIVVAPGGGSFCDPGSRPGVRFFSCSSRGSTAFPVRVPVPGD